MQKLLAFFLAMLLSVSIIAGCGSNSPKSNDKQTTQTTTVNTTKSNNGQNTAANVKANSGKIKISESAAYTDKEHVAAHIVHEPAPLDAGQPFLFLQAFSPRALYRRFPASSQAPHLYPKPQTVVM